MGYCKFLKILTHHPVLTHGRVLTYKKVIKGIVFKEMLHKTILRLRCAIRPMQLRTLAKLSVNLKENAENRMQAWQIHSYNGLGDLKLSNVRLPLIRNPSDVLVKVEAASINSLDVAMTGTS